MSRIHLGELELVNFRNISRIELNPHPRFNIVAGRNGMGKTNVLEAIYLFGALRSFRTSTRGDLILHGAEETRLRGVFSGAASGLCCEINVRHDSRKVRADGKAISIRGGHFRSLPMVLFHPATMTLVQGGPKERRLFLDRALFQAEPNYPAFHRDYLRALASRNRLLKQHPVDGRSLSPFNHQLGELGEQIINARERFVEGLAPLFSEAFENISLGSEASIAYQPKVQGDKEVIIKALENDISKDKARGFTSIGPHGDDVSIEIGNRPARKFASQGQQRMIALSLKAAETNALTTATERIPILLLDDISSELDRDRNRQLFKFLASVGGQVFITTTHLDHILIEEDRKDFEIENGQIVRSPRA